MFITRLLTALVGIPIGLVLAHRGDWALGALLGGFTLIGQHELFEAARRRGYRPQTLVAYFFGLMLVAVSTVWPSAAHLQIAVSIAFVVVCLSAEVAWSSPTHLANLGVTLLGYFYVAWLFSFILLLRALRPGDMASILGWQVPFGWAALVYVLGVTWFSDTAAFAVGRRYGRRKLCPAISPHKTVEGSYGAVCVAVMASLLFGAAMGLGVGHCLLLGLAMGVVGQVGDLAKSILKREAGLKDFGSLLPGHGGILDRFDAVLFNVVIAYYYLSLMPRP
jgi:phosphatidate cytidylyltransferase